MPLDDELRHAAEHQGIQQDFWDIFGKQHFTDPETNRAILTAMGLDCSSETALRCSLARREPVESGTVFPPVMVVSEHEPVQLPGAEAIEAETHAGEKFQLNMADVPEGLRLPLGYHEFHLGHTRMRIAVTPDCAWCVPPGKYAGFGVTLYGLRSERNWGVGDFRDLRDLIDWAVDELGVDFIALNPLHAIHNRRPYNTSPYLPNSIFYRNFLYIDVEAVPGYELVREQLQQEGLESELERLRACPTVAYEDTAAIKRRALELIFKAEPPGLKCRAWIENEGELLRSFATYCAIDEHLHQENPDLWIWPDWPAEYRDPGSVQVRRFAATHEREIVFHGWLQWLIDQQLEAAQAYARERGMAIGLYHDLALATDRCGSDLWGHRKFYVAGCRVGSPPDDFSPTGQDWSFPPPCTEQHRQDGYKLFRDSIRKSMRHGGALRIDHVMRLFRLYWIPEGHDAAHGAYVREKAEDLVRVLALESVLNRCLIVGEDLGTVEPAVRETLSRFNILSYRLLYFEREGGRFKQPNEYPAQALASTTTHDLATIAGFWAGTDIDARLRAGTIDEGGFHAQMHDRGRDKQALLDALFTAGMLSERTSRDATHIPELTPELHHAIARYLAETPCALWLINQEDLTLAPAQQNLPGTTAQYPNWSARMRWTINELRENPEARERTAMFAALINSSGRRHRAM